MRGIRVAVIGAGAMAAGLVLASAPAFAQPWEGRPNAVAVFGARMADNNWIEIATIDDLGVRDAWLVGVALSRELAGTGRGALEAEVQGVRHFGEQGHWETNAALVARWRSFPWNRRLPTSVAFGIGPSYASKVPAEEVARDASSARLLLYWVAELEVGARDGPWSGLARLHHRSNAYGVFAEEGGSNWLTLGLRRRF